MLTWVPPAGTTGSEGTPPLGTVPDASPRGPSDPGVEDPLPFLETTPNHYTPHFAFG